MQPDHHDQIDDDYDDHDADDDDQIDDHDYSVVDEDGDNLIDLMPGEDVRHIQRTSKNSNILTFLAIFYMFFDL